MSQPGSVTGGTIPWYHEDHQFSQAARNAVGDLRRIVKKGARREKVDAIKACLSYCKIYAEERDMINDPYFLEKRVGELNQVLPFNRNKRIYRRALKDFPDLKSQVYQILKQ